MAESSAHIFLVNRLLQQAKTLVSKDAFSLIYVDTPESREKPPRTMQNFTPDLFLKYNGLMVIGEAKTLNDVTREHSASQYESYLEEIKNFDGTSILIFAVPWQTKATIKNTISIMKNKINKSFDCYIITEIGSAEKV